MDEDYYNQFTTRNIVCSVFFVIAAVLALVTNLVLIVTICARKSMRSALNSLIASLAIADILLVLPYVILRPTIIMHVKWPLGTFICKLSRLLESTTSAVSMITLVAISIVLFKLIMCPSQKPLTTYEGVKTAIAIWMVNIFVAIPEFMVAGLHTISLCFLWPGHDYMGVFYTTFFALWKYLIPAILLTVMYGIILCKGFRSYCPIGRTHDDNDNFRCHKKMAKIMAIVTAVQLICFFMYSVFGLYYRLPIEPRSIELSENVLLFTDWLAMMSTSIKPVIYFVMSAKLRSNIQETFSCR